MSIRVIHGDCRTILPMLEAGSFDAIVTDPPYHLTTGKKGGTGIASLNVNSPAGRSRIGTGFMGKAWDGGDIAFRPETWAAALRLLKPGAFMVCFASTRGYHRMVCAIEDAGFIIHPMLGWITGQGFPKASRFDQPDLDGWRYGLQALKPALEPICMAQKPMEGIGSQNWAKHGVGGINIDACRVALDPVADASQLRTMTRNVRNAPDGWGMSTVAADAPTVVRSDGRWPSNILHDGSDEVMAAFAAYGESKSSAGVKDPNGSMGYHGGASGLPGVVSGHSDSGTAARFFYSAKADADDRAWSKHPTVKPLSLMRWLCRLLTPPGGHIIDPFAGSGTTGEAARCEGFDVTLIERDAEYVADIGRRVGRASGDDTPLFAEVARA